MRCLRLDSPECALPRVRRREARRPAANESERFRNSRHWNDNLGAVAQSGDHAACRAQDIEHNAHRRAQIEPNERRKFGRRKQDLETSHPFSDLFSCFMLIIDLCLQGHRHADNFGVTLAHRLIQRCH